MKTLIQSKVIVNYYPDNEKCNTCQFSQLLLDSQNERPYICLLDNKVYSKKCEEDYIVKELECTTDCNICISPNCDIANDREEI